MTTFNLPDLGEGLQEAEIVAWHVTVGDHVVADQPLLAVETEKAVVEIPSPQSGRIAKLFGKPGDIVKIGAPLADFEEGAPADAGTVVGVIAKPAAAGAKPVRAQAPATPGKTKATPAVRALARKSGVDLAVVAPTGKEGQVTKADVERAAKALAEAGPIEPLRGPRRAMARKMSRAHAEAVPATVTDEADIESWSDDSDAMVRLIRAVAAGCTAEPALNAWYDAKNEGRRLHETINLGIAVDTPDGLFVPVLRDIGNREEADLRQAFDALKATVEGRTIAPRDLLGQTITLSNFGTIGGRFGALVVAPPQVAILGAGRARPRVVAADGKPTVRRILPLSLTFDHRAVTGGEAARFLAAAIADLERPA